jgi:hypothetical protein
VNIDQGILNEAFRIFNEFIPCVIRTQK